MRDDYLWKICMSIIGVLLLAIVCIGSIELLVCKYAEPALYARITTPVVQFAKDTAQSVTKFAKDTTQSVTKFAKGAAQGAAEQSKQVLAYLSSLQEQAEEEQPEEVPVDQTAKEPAITEAYPEETPQITEFSMRGDKEVLTGGVVEMVYFNQGEEPWANQLYGRDSIRGYGCGPVCMSMLVSTLTEQTVNPAEMAQLASQEGYCAPGSGSYLSIVQGIASMYGIEAEPYTQWSPQSLINELASGHLFVALMGPGHFTSGGHFIVLRGITLEGKVLVADPNSRERSQIGWDPEIILDELSASRSNGAPLWRISSLPSLGQ